MKKLSILFLSAIALTTTFTSCSKDDDKPADTALELIMKDFNNNSALLSDVNVALFESTDAEEPLQTGVSGTDGKVVFKGLKSQIYYFAAQTGATAGCKTNYYSTISSGTTAIPAGKTTSVNVLMVSEGTIKLTNNTTNNYLVAFKLGSNDYQTAGRISGKASADAEALLFNVPFLAGTYKMQLTPCDVNGVAIPGADSIVTDVTLDACGDFPFAIN